MLQDINRHRLLLQDHFYSKASSKIDPKRQKGKKKKIEEEDESEKEWEEEEERNRVAEEEATNEALIKNFDDIKARIERMTKNSSLRSFQGGGGARKRAVHKQKNDKVLHDTFAA
ncbi:hypothetical protein Tco_1096095 [Tanacetum coccineum]